MLTWVTESCSVSDRQRDRFVYWLHLPPLPAHAAVWAAARRAQQEAGGHGGPAPAGGACQGDGKAGAALAAVRAVQTVSLRRSLEGGRLQNQSQNACLSWIWMRENGSSHKFNFFLCLYVYLFWYFFVPCGKFGLPYLGKTWQPLEQRYLFLSVCTVFSCVQTMVWLPVCGIFNLRTNIDTGGAFLLFTCIDAVWCVVQKWPYLCWCSVTVSAEMTTPVLMQHGA